MPAGAQCLLLGGAYWCPLPIGAQFPVVPAAHWWLLVSAGAWFLLVPTAHQCPAIPVGAYLCPVPTGGCWFPLTFGVNNAQCPPVPTHAWCQVVLTSVWCPLVSSAHKYFLNVTPTKIGTFQLLTVFTYCLSRSSKSRIHLWLCIEREEWQLSFLRHSRWCRHCYRWCCISTTFLPTHYLEWIPNHKAVGSGGKKMLIKS